MCELCRLIRQQEATAEEICRLLRRKDEYEHLRDWIKSLAYLRQKRTEVRRLCKSMPEGNKVAEHERNG
jgi:hypothetical protein